MGLVKSISWVYQESFKGVSRVFQGSFKSVSLKFQEYFKGVSRKFEGCLRERLKGVWCGLDGRFKEILRLLQIDSNWYFKQIFFVFQGSFRGSKWKMKGFFKVAWWVFQQRFGGI